MPIETCDMCRETYDFKDRWEVRTPRPSDPTDMCCVMWVCPKCGQSQLGPSCKTPAQWNDWIENEGAAKGYIWLS